MAALFIALVMRRGDPSSSSSSAQSGEVVFQGRALGTSWTVKLVASSVDEAALRRALEGALADVDEKMSTWRQDSELSRLNAAGAGPVTVSAELMTVLSAAEDLSRRSDGAFDVTVGPLVAAWGFGAGRAEQPPTAAELERLRAVVGYQYVALDRAARIVERRRDGVKVDLSAIAKGYAVDQMGAVLRDAGVSRFMVEVGGEVLVAGKSASDGPWRLGIEAPDAAGRAVARIIEVEEGALATSGDYRQFREVDGRVISHTIDPRTGRPVDHGPASVSVVAPPCMTADAWATALMVMGPMGLPLATRAGLAVLILERQEDGSVKAHQNSAFEALSR